VCDKNPSSGEVGNSGSPGESGKRGADGQRGDVNLPPG
jgi:hypothetical protein